MNHRCVVVEGQFAMPLVIGTLVIGIGEMQQQEAWNGQGTVALGAVLFIVPHQGGHAHELDQPGGCQAGNKHLQGENDGDRSSHTPRK